MKKMIFGALALVSLLLFTTGCNASDSNTTVKAEKSAKCGTGKCGDSKKDAKKCGDGKAETKKCGDGKPATKKCGAGKCGDGK